MHLTFNKEKCGKIFANKTIESIVTHSFDMRKNKNENPTLLPPAAYPTDKLPIKELQRFRTNK